MRRRKRSGLQRWIPILDWLPKVRDYEIRGDIMGGLTVWVLLVPQGMAYALIAGLPPIYGLYAALVPLIVYPLLGTSRHLAIGPIAIDMLIVGAGISLVVDPTAHPEEAVILAAVLAILVGVIQIVAGFARFGFVAVLLSRPVITGFMASAALIIAFSQIGTLLGIELPRDHHIHIIVYEAALHIRDLHWISLAIGAGGIGFLLMMKAWKPVFPSALVLVTVTSLISWASGFGGGGGVEVIGSVPSGLPSPRLPATSWETVRTLLPTAATLALVQFMNVVSLGRIFGARHRYAISANRELFAIGTSNLLGSLFRGMPVSGSLSRTAINEQAGGQTPLSNVITAGLLVLTLLFLTPLFYYLPMPALAAIIMVAALGLVDMKELWALYKTKRRDGLIALVTFMGTLVIGIQEGILLGISGSILSILYRVTRPNVAQLGVLPGTQNYRDLGRNPEAIPIANVLILRVDAPYSFANAEYFKEFILDKSQEDDHDDLRAVIIDGRGISDLDTTALESLRSVLRSLDRSDVELLFTGLIGPVRNIASRAGLYEEFGEEHFHLSVHWGVTSLLANWDRKDGTNRLDEYLALTASLENGGPPEPEIVNGTDELPENLFEDDAP